MGKVLLAIVAALTLYSTTSRAQRVGQQSENRCQGQNIQVGSREVTVRQGTGRGEGAHIQPGADAGQSPRQAPTQPPVEH